MQQRNTMVTVIPNVSGALRMNFLRLGKGPRGVRNRMTGQSTPKYNFEVSHTKEIHGDWGDFRL